MYHIIIIYLVVTCIELSVRCLIRRIFFIDSTILYFPVANTTRAVRLN